MAKAEAPYVGVDLGGTSIKMGVLDAKDRLITTAKTKTKGEEGGEAVVKRIARVVREMLEEAKLKTTDLGGLGIGAPGTIDIDKGVVVNATNLRWNKFPLGKLLGADLGVAVTVDNDVNVGTWGEVVLGAAKGFKDVLGVFVGTGIGGGLVLDGRLYHGHFSTAGEIGHTVIHADAPLGRRTLEQCASRTSIVNQLVQLMLANHPSKLWELCERDITNIRSKALGQAVEMEDELTLEVVGKGADYVGIAIANIVTVLSLPCVVVGGGLTEAVGKRYVERVRQSFKANVFPPELRECQIVASKLEDNAGVVGAALLARERQG